MARIETPKPEEMTPEQREVHDAIVSGPRGRIEGPFGPLLHRPGLAAPAQELGRYCRYDSSLPPALSEIAICTVGRHWRAEYEWYAHRRMALQAGVSEAVLDAIRDGAPPPFADETAEVVHAVAESLLETKRLPEALYARAERLLGREGLVDLVGIVGYYCLVSVTLNAFEVDLPPGETPAFPD
jgi:4-carboxymuconolactone decarboxylase